MKGESEREGGGGRGGVDEKNRPGVDVKTKLR